MLTWDWPARDRAALQTFLAERSLLTGPVRTRPVGDGRSNLTFVVDDGTRTVVLRRPPPPPTPPGAHDVEREARLLAALGGTPVPVPEVLAVAPAGAVLDVAFVVLEHVAGPVITDRTPPPLDAPAARREIADDMVDTLVALHGVDAAGAGLADFGRPDGFNARHVRRMARLIADADGAPPPAFASLTEWLLAQVPAESAAAIVHNDYRLGNLIVAADRPGRVAAVLDWELATLGDPLWDVGYLLASCPAAGGPATPTTAFAAAMHEPGWPTRDELAQRYANVSGRDLSALPWYTAAVHWKLAVLYEYQRQRTVDGVGDPYYADPGHVRSFLAAAARAASAL